MAGPIGKRFASLLVSSRFPRIALAFTIVLGLCLIGALSSGGVDSVDGTEISDDGIVYKITSETDKTVAIIGYEKIESNLSIPDAVKYEGTHYTVTAIEHHAFERCVSLFTVMIPNTIHTIGDDAFIGCPNLRFITIPDSVTSIGEFAFFDCEGLEYVQLGKGASDIGNSAFANCFNNKEFRVSPYNETYSSVDGVLMNKEGTRLIMYPTGKEGGYVVPYSVKSIEEGAFSRCVELTSVTIHEDVESLGPYAFIGCTSLKKVTLNDRITAIKQYTFYNCTSLSTVVMGSNITVIGDNAFTRCGNLKSITLPENIMEIGIDAFQRCAGLKSVEIPDNVVSIKEGAFRLCTGITTLRIGNGVETIGEEAFRGCSNITSLTLGESVRVIGEDAFCGCGALKSLKIPNSVRSIEPSAFSNCIGLKSLEIPDGVQKIGPFAFHGCSGLTNVKIGAGVISIGGMAFTDCSNLKSIDVALANTSYASRDGVLYNKDYTELVKYPDSKDGILEILETLIEIESSALANCSNLTSFIVHDNNPSFKSIDGILYSKDGETLIRCPATMNGPLTIPKEAVWVSTYAFNDCIGITEFIVESGNMSLSSSKGVLFDLTGKVLIKYPGAKEGEYTVEENVNVIYEAAFTYCYGLTKLSVPYKGADHSTYFKTKSCPNLTEIVLCPENIKDKTYDGAVFDSTYNELIYCPEGKRTLEFPETMSLIASDAVRHCDKLTEVIVINGNRIEIADCAFLGSNPDLVFKSGKEGFDLKVYSDQAMTTEVTGTMLASGWGGTLYLKWTEISDDDGTGGDEDVGFLIGTIIGIITIIGASMLMIFQRKSD